MLASWPSRPFNSYLVIFIIGMKAVITIFLISAVDALYAQIPQFKYTATEFTTSTNNYVAYNSRMYDFINAFFSKNRIDFHERLCNSGQAYLKFRVDASGISEIACTNNAPEILRDGLKQAAKASEKYWITDKSSVGKIILMPIIYDYRKSEGCSNENQTRDQFSGDLNFF